MIRVTEVRLVDRLLLVGPPGIGKTEIVRQKAMEEAARLKRQFIDLSEERGLLPSEKLEILKRVRANPSEYYVFYRIVATHLTPEDTGVPRDIGDAVVFKPPIEFAILAVEGVAGVLFIDELSNVQRDDVLTLLFALINEKRFGWGVKLSSKVKVVAAANPDEYSTVARPLPAPLLNRLKVVRVTAPTVEEWIRYMDYRFGDDWDKRVGAFLASNSDYLFKPPVEPEGFDNFPTPRAWTMLATEVYSLFRDDAVPDNNVYTAYVLGTVGRDAGSKYLSFIKWRPPTPEELLKNPRLLLKNNTLDYMILCMLSFIQNLERLREKFGDDRVVKAIEELLSLPSAAEAFQVALSVTKKQFHKFILSLDRAKRERLIRNAIVAHLGTASAAIYGMEVQLRRELGQD